MNYLAVFLGGGIGSLARFGVSRMLTDQSFPFATLVANLLSSFILGVMLGLTLKEENSLLKYLVAIGFCGGFSTFSTFSADTFNLLSTGQLFSALSNIIANVVICLIAIWLGLLLVK